MPFIELKNTKHQHDLVSCVPTMVQVIFDNFFPESSRKIAHWKKMLEWTPLGGVVIDCIKFLDEWCNEKGIDVNIQSDMTITELKDLNSNGETPFVYLRSNYNTTSRTMLSVSEDGEKWFHPVLILDIDEEFIYLFDTELPQTANFKREDAIKLKITTFLREWNLTAKEGYWFSRKVKKDADLSKIIQQEDERLRN